MDINAVGAAEWMMSARGSEKGDDHIRKGNDYARCSNKKLNANI
jgi:hypothetical protein